MVVFSQVGLFAGGLLQYLLPFAFVFTLLVFFHELGHFLVGRLCGVGVDTFSIGFGRELFGFTDRHGTRWRWALIPLGGYVKFHGDLNGASIPDAKAEAAMTPAERRTTLFAQPIWKRAAIVAAGPIASFLLAIIIFSATLYAFGQHIVVPRVQTVFPNSAAAAAGFKPGDLVLSIDGQKINSFSDIQAIIALSDGDKLTFQVERDGSIVQLIATPRREIVSTPFGKQRQAHLGIGASTDPQDIRVRTLDLPQAVALGASETWQFVDQTVTFLARLSVGREAADQLSGPVGIAAMSGEVAKLGFISLLNWAAVLSSCIGFFNLLPIPLLDGGHLLYFAIEAVRGRPLSIKAQELGFRIGLAIVAILMVFVTSNDLLHLMPKVFGFTG